MVSIPALGGRWVRTRSIAPSDCVNRQALAAHVEASPSSCRSTRPRSGVTRERHDVTGTTGGRNVRWRQMLIDAGHDLLQGVSRLRAAEPDVNDSRGCHGDLISGLDSEQAVQDQAAHERVISCVLGTAEQPRQGCLAVHSERFGHHEVEQVPRHVSELPLAHEPLEKWSDSVIQRPHQSVQICQTR